MATYLTGRTRTLTFSGALGGVQELFLGIPPPPPAIPVDGGAGIVLNASTWIGNFTVSWTQEPGFAICWIYCEALSSGNTTETRFDNGGELGVLYSYDSSGTWSMTAPVEEVIEIDYGSYPSGNLGTQLIDPPLPCSVTVYERLVIGGYVNVSVSLPNAGSGSASALITSSNVLSLYYQYGNYDASAQAFCYSREGFAGYASVTAFVNGVSVGAPSSSGSDTYHTWDATAGAYATCNSLPPGGSGPEDTSMQVSMYASPMRTFTQAGQISALSQPYPADIKVVLYQYAGSAGVVVDAPSGGSFSSSYTQQRYGWGYIQDEDYYESPGYGTTFDNHSAASGIIQAASLTANGEDYTLNRLLCRGFKWNAMTMTQAASMNVDNAPQIANWTAGTNTTLANSGSDELTAAVSGGLGRRLSQK